MIFFKSKYRHLFAAILLVIPTLVFSQQSTHVIDSLVAEGENYLGRENFNAAERAFKAVLKLDRQVIPAHIGLGKIDVARRKWDDANDDFSEVLKIDPESLLGHYYRAVCFREQGTQKALLLRKIDWDKSKRHFKWVIERDPAFRDVLYQYAKLLQYRGKYRAALVNARVQVLKRPDLIAPQVGFFRLGRYLIDHLDREEALSWLRAQDWPEADYFIAELWRLQGQFAPADSLLHAMLQDSSGMSRSTIYLALSRNAYACGKTEQAQNYYWLAIDSVSTATDAGLIFEDLKYIVTNAELEQFRKLDSPQAWRNFFRAFWTKRDPTPAAPINARLAEHYRRLLYCEKNYAYDGFKSWANNPDKFSYLSFPKAYYLNHEFNDRGLIYLRHGPPDERVNTVTIDAPTNESWRYWKRGNDPELTFHFVVDEMAAPNNWRLTPTIRNAAMLQDRIEWGTVYYRMARASPLEFLSLEAELIEESKESAKIGFETDRHSWRKSLKPLPMAYTVASFMGEAGSTTVDIYYSFPLKPVLKNIASATPDFEEGLAIFDLAWQQKVLVRQTYPLPIELVRGKISPDISGALRTQVLPDSYRVALHVQPKGSDLLGGYNFGYRARDFRPDTLLMSDLILAENIAPASGGGKFVRHGLAISVKPTLQFSRKQQVYVYFEAYHLRRDESGKSRFDVEYTVQLEKQKKSVLKKLFGIFGGGGKSAISVSAERETAGPTAIEYIALDPGQLKSGDYRLQVSVRDRANGARAQAALRFQLL